MYMYTPVGSMHQDSCAFFQLWGFQKQNQYIHKEEKPKPQHIKTLDQHLIELLFHNGQVQTLQEGQTCGIQGL